MKDLLDKILMKRKDGSLKNLTVIIADDDALEKEDDEMGEDDEKEQGLAPDAEKEEKEEIDPMAVKGMMPSERDELEVARMADGNGQPKGLRAKAQVEAFLKRKK